MESEIVTEEGEKPIKLVVNVNITINKTDRICILCYLL